MLRSSQFFEAEFKHIVSIAITGKTSDEYTAVGGVKGDIRHACFLPFLNIILYSSFRVSVPIFPLSESWHGSKRNSEVHSL